MEYQTTINRPFTLSGPGLHTGKYTHATVKPAPSDTGILIRRTDLEKEVEIPALAENVCDTNHGTTVAVGDVVVSTIEHMMSALHGMRVDNAYIDVDGPEVPILDGSARLFREFTLTVLLKGLGGANDMNITFLGLNALRFRLVKGGADAKARVCINPGITGAPESCNDIDINANDKIVSLSVIGKPDALRVYVNAGSNPVISLSKTDWDNYKAASWETPEPTMRRDFPDLRIQSDANTAYIYGVRYYQNNALSVNRERKKGGYLPSGLERNFKMDAKRYGIGSNPTYTPTF